MKTSELEQMIEDSMEHVREGIEEKILERVPQLVSDKLDEMAKGQNKTQKAHFNPYSGYLDGKPKTAEGMENYMNENYGVHSVQNKTFKGMFGEENLSSGGFDSMGEFFKLVDSGLNDSRLITKAPSGSNEGIPSDGGFIVPNEYTARIFDVALESEIIRPLATVYPMKSKTLEIPAMELTNHSTALYGNVEMKWVDEGGTVTPTKPAFRAMKLTAHKARIDLVATNELLADSSPNYEQVIGKVVTSTFAYGLDSIFLNGHGGGQPLGVLNSNCLITVAAEVDQTITTIVWENIVNMYSRMHPACVGNAVWVASITAIPQLMTLYFSVGVGGSAIPALKEDSGKFYLLGKRVFITEKLPVLGQVGDIMLCDFSQYAIGMRQELRIEKSNSPGWSTDESSWRCIARIDGQPLWDKVLTLKDGSTTVSPFITLAART
jgi:HK97 family phage major capsid protein